MTQACCSYTVTSKTILDQADQYGEGVGKPVKYGGGPLESIYLGALIPVSVDFE